MKWMVIMAVEVVIGVMTVVLPWMVQEVVMVGGGGGNSNRGGSGGGDGNGSGDGGGGDDGDSGNSDGGVGGGDDGGNSDGGGGSDGGAVDGRPMMMVAEMVVLVVMMMVYVQTSLVHTSGSQILHVEPFEAHSRGPLTPRAIPPMHTGHQGSWEGGFEKALAHLLRP